MKKSKLQSLATDVLGDVSVIEVSDYIEILDAKTWKTLLLVSGFNKTKRHKVLCEALKVLNEK